MPTVTSAAQALGLAAKSWEPRGRCLAIGRCLLALATLVEIVCTPDSDLFISGEIFRDSAYCGGLRAISLWCVDSFATHSYLAARAVSICVLVLVLTGYRPRWTCVPHWYVTFSLASSVVAESGGDAAAKIITLLLLPALLRDDRDWQWSRPTVPLPPRWRGGALAAQLVIRLQVFVVYVVAATSKLRDEAWRQGSALYYIAYDPVHGFPPSLLRLLAPAVDSYGAVAALSWSTIGVEAVIALTILGPRKARWVALSFGISLHAAIGVLMGLGTFAFVMIGLLTVAFGGRFAPDRLTGPEAEAGGVVVSHELTGSHE
jgi:antimicrobial peptide system SdpB family protein